MVQDIKGNLQGVPKHLLEEMAAWYDYNLEKDLLVDEFLGQALARLSLRLNREIALYINRQGKILQISLGSRKTVSLAGTAIRRSEQRLSGIRCLHTHPSGSGHLSALDFAALRQLRLDCMAALGINEKAEITSIGLARWPGTDQEMEIFSSLPAAQAFNLSAYIALAEEAFHQCEAPKQFQAALLVSLTGGRDDEEVETSLAELGRLAETAGLLAVGQLLQHKDKPSPATYIGKGKVEELRHLAQISDADLIVFDEALSPAQLYNLEEQTGRPIADRSILILDIFAKRARSNEGKLQVELAQLKYMLPRIRGQGLALSRLGGGIGTRGPGETKLETDQRKIRRRIQDLEERLDEVMRTRELHRRKRREEELPLVALVGYTNAGKSSLLNALSNSQTYAENLLFATLDTLTRKVSLASGQSFLLGDTVGFIRRLPHHLIAAFRATLEEVREADLLLHVVDGSAEDAQVQFQAVMDVLQQLGVADKPVITVVNKADLIENPQVLKRLLALWEGSLAVSARHKEGFERLLAAIEENLSKKWQQVEILLPFSAGSLLSLLHDEGHIISENYREDGVLICAQVPEKVYGRISPLIVRS
ncbi:MAG: GTPase HflX [Clostridiales bacterium]|nr:GTPase HflX [Clostridiales bacterium]